MADQTPPLITEQQFNEKVLHWTITTKSKMSRNVPVSTGKDSSSRKSKKLANSIYHIMKKEYGATSRVQLNFEKHGIFLHHGVGRGYIKKGGYVVRGYVFKTRVYGSRIQKGRKENSKIVVGDGSINRHPVDWFDVEIVAGLSQLADITQEFYGDLAMRKILNNIDRYLIRD